MKNNAIVLNVKLLLVTTFVLFAFQSRLFAQTPEKAFNKQSHAIGLRAGFGNCSINSHSEHFTINPGKIVQLSYDYNKPLRKWYNLGIGAHCGFQYLNAETVGFEKNLAAKGRNFVANVPVYVRRYFPLNNKIGMTAKIGAEAKMLLGGHWEFGSKSENKLSQLDVHYDTNQIPQLDFLSGVGLSYILKNNSFVLFELEWGCNIINPDKYYNFEYINREVSDNWIYDSFRAKYAQSITFALKYNFKLQNN